MSDFKWHERNLGIEVDADRLAKAAKSDSLVDAVMKVMGASNTYQTIDVPTKEASSPDEMIRDAIVSGRIRISK